VLKSFLLERMRIPSTPKLGLTLRMLSEVGQRLTALVYEQARHKARNLLIREMKRMLTGYLFVAPAM
jgi:hypothetical protein